MLHTLKPFILFLTAFHLLKCILLFVYNRQKNSAVDFSDFISYISAIPKLYIEEGENSIFRKLLFGMHYTVLVLWAVLLTYALVKLI
ncbi:MAG: hypothetical protein JNL95_10825 [Chitinophagales bacterium]|nr:hypothetical protein [Chitinophagales bacterium]